MQAWLLGAGGWMPTRKHDTCSALIRDESHALIIDAGSGLRHLMEQPQLLEGVERIDLLLTHFHLDHIVGLGFQPGLNLPVAPTVHAPGAALYGAPSQEILERVLSQPTLHADLGSMIQEVREIDPERAWSSGSFHLDFRVQTRHSAPTLGLRLGDQLAYCTDTAYDPQTPGFARGCQLLCHDAWWHAAAPDAVATHASGEQCGKIAAAAGVERLVLIHHHPRGGHEQVLAEAVAVHPRSVAGHDLMRLF